MATSAQTQPVTDRATTLSFPIVTGCSWAPSSWTLVSRAGAPMSCQRCGGDSFPPRRRKSSIPCVSAACAARPTTTCSSTMCWCRRTLRAFPQGSFLGLGFVAVGLGTAPSAIDTLTELAGAKVCHRARELLCGQEALSTELARAEALLRSFQDVPPVRLPKVVHCRRSSRCSGNPARAVGPRRAQRGRAKPRFSATEAQ